MTSKEESEQLAKEAKERFERWIAIAKPLIIDNRSKSYIHQILLTNKEFEKRYREDKYIFDFVFSEAKKELKKEQNYEKIKDYSKTEKETVQEIPLEEISQFKDPQLLLYIKQELDKKHIYDDFEKLTVFLVCCTSQSINARDRKSLASIGDSSVGKDNLLDTVAEHFPRVLKITRATESTLEDDIAEADIIRFSEINANRDDGANKTIIETLKQLAEGGISAMKKDASTGFKTTRHSTQEQKTLLFGTTEERRDEELETRFITVSVRKDSRKIKAVNKNTGETWSNPDKLLAIKNNNPSWIYSGIGQLKKLHVLIPYAEKIIPIFDNEEPRSQRDVKRILSLTASHAWLYQLQRPIIEYKGQSFIVAMPVDFINVFKISGSFFNMTYKGLEDRLQQILDAIEEMTGGDFGKEVLRIDLEKKLGIAKNTLKDRLEILRKNNFVEVRKEGEKHNAIWYYKRCQTGCQRLLMVVNLQELKEILYKDIDNLYQPLDIFLDKIKMAENAEIDIFSFFTNKVVKTDKDVDNHELIAKNTSKNTDDSISVTFDNINLTTSFVTPKGLLDNIKSLGTPSISDLESLYPGENVRSIIDALRFKGDIIEHSNGTVMAVEK